MSFSTKFKKSFSNFSNISFPDFALHELSNFSDFLELILIFSKDGTISKGDVQDRFFGTKSYTDSQERDDDEAFINSLFDVIYERSVLYRDDYPFEFDSSSVLLKRKSVFSIKQRAYIYLLIASNLNIFRPFQSVLTNDFESVSKLALCSYLTPKAIVKEFGSNSAYSGTAQNKIMNLAIDLGLEIDSYEVSQINERNTKERGLDIVAWIPFEDSCVNKEIYLCQCACGKGFEMKQHDTRRFKNYIKFYKKGPTHIMFIPYSLINYQKGKFYHSDLIEDDFIFFERKRILSLCSFRGFTKFQSYKLVNKVIKYSEGLV